MCSLEQLIRKCAKLNLHASSVADPDLGSGAFLAPGSGKGKKSRSGSEINIPDHISESLEIIFEKYLNSLMRMRIWDTGIVFTLDPGWKKFESGIRYKNSDSAMLHASLESPVALDFSLLFSLRKKLSNRHTERGGGVCVDLKLSLRGGGGCHWSNDNTSYLTFLMFELELSYLSYSGVVDVVYFFQDLNV